MGGHILLQRGDARSGTPALRRRCRRVDCLQISAPQPRGFGPGARLDLLQQRGHARGQLGPGHDLLGAGVAARSQHAALLQVLGPQLHAQRHALAPRRHAAVKRGLQPFLGSQSPGAPGSMRSGDTLATAQRHCCDTQHPFLMLSGRHLTPDCPATLQHASAPRQPQQ